jgi:sRNA-binding regulator protein Hfq
MNQFKTILEESHQSKKGITVYVNGIGLDGYVTKIDDKAIELKSRTYSKIVVLIEKVDAIAIG